MTKKVTIIFSEFIGFQFLNFRRWVKNLPKKSDYNLMRKQLRQKGLSMKKICVMKKTYWIPFSFCFTLLLIFWTTVHSEQPLSKGLRGPAFSDPAKQVKMPDGWEKQPVKHDPSLMLTLQ